MKKLFVAVIVIAFGVGNVFGVGEINVNAGLQVSGSVTTNYLFLGSDTVTPSMGFSIGANYVYPLNDIIKAGGGIDILMPRSMNKEIDGSAKFTLVPIYGVIYFNPFKEAKGVYLKGKLGYAIFSMSDVSSDPGFTWGMGAGYEFENFFTLGLAYDVYYPNVYESIFTRFFTYSTLTINVGYKFKV